MASSPQTLRSGTPLNWTIFTLKYFDDDESHVGIVVGDDVDDGEEIKRGGVLHSQLNFESRERY